jgi:hypothetical protein
MPNIADTGEFISNLHHNILSKKPKDFLPWVFCNLKKHIKFDKVFFATLDENKVFLPSFPFFGERFKITKNSKYIQITNKNTNTNTYQYISLFSKDGFSEQDVVIMQIIFPSIASSLLLNIKYNARFLTDSYAIFDNNFNMLHVKSEFIEHIKKPYKKTNFDHIFNENLGVIQGFSRGGGGVIVSLKIIDKNVFECVNYLDFYVMSVRKLTEFDLLTHRQKQVAELLVKNKTYKEIAYILEISANTVVKHVNSIYAKLNIKKSHQIKIPNKLTSVSK